jgi:hypothetical protein
LKVRLAALADYSNTSREGKLNILGVFDIIHCLEFPAVHNEMQLVMRFEADVTERGQQKEVEVRLIDDHGEELLRLGGHLSVPTVEPGEFIISNQVLVFQGITFPRPGDYQFDIYIEGIKTAGTPLKVVQMHTGPSI